MNVNAVLAKVAQVGGKKQERIGGFALPLVEITGGEPLLQSPVYELMDELCERDYQVLLETSGAHNITNVNEKVCRIVDLKCPSSGESHRMHWENIFHLTKKDEIKFVIASNEDYDWAKNVLTKHHLYEICPILFSSAMPLPDPNHASQLKRFPMHRCLSRSELAERVIADRLPVRFQLQMHKFIWSPDRLGV